MPYASNQPNMNFLFFQWVRSKPAREEVPRVKPCLICEDGEVSYVDLKTQGKEDLYGPQSHIP